ASTSASASSAKGCCANTPTATAATSIPTPCRACARLPWLPRNQSISERRLLLIAAGGVVPAADVCGQLVGLARAPGAGLVLVDGRHVAEHGVYDAPRSLDRVLAREERRVALHRVAQQTLVGRRVVAGVFMRDQFDVLAGHRLALDLR